MEKKITITVDDTDFEISSDFDQEALVFWLEFVKVKILTREGQ